MNPQQPRLRSILFLPIALLTVFALVASGCSGDDDAEEVTVTDDSEITETDDQTDDETDVDESTVDLSNEEARAAIEKSFGAIESGPMRIVGEMEMAGGFSDMGMGLGGVSPSADSGPMVITFEMETDGENFAMKNTMKMTNPEDGEAMDIEVEQRFVDGVMYQNLAGMFGAMFGGAAGGADSDADTPNWVATDLGEGVLTDPRDDAGIFSEEDLSDIDVFEDMGLVERDGTTLRRIVAEGSAGDMAEDLDDLRTGDERMDNLLSHVMENYHATIEFFLHEDGSMHSYRISTGLDVDSGTCKALQQIEMLVPEMTGEFRFEALPADYVVEAPDPADVMDMSEMFGGMGDVDLDDFDFGFDDMDFDFDEDDSPSGADAPSFENDFDFSDEDFAGCPTS